MSELRTNVIKRLRFAMEVLDATPADQQPVCKSKDAAEAVAELMRIAELAADLLENSMNDQVDTTPIPKPRHPAVAAVLQFFAYAHLPAHLQEISKPFCELAEKVADGPQNAEATVALRKLLEAKDAAVRAFLFKP